MSVAGCSTDDPPVAGTDDAGSIGSGSDPGGPDADTTGSEALSPSPFALSDVSVTADALLTGYFDVSLTIQNTGTVESPVTAAYFYVNVGHGVLVPGFPFTNLSDECPLHFILLPSGMLRCTVTFDLNNAANGAISEVRYDDGATLPVTIAAAP